MVETADQSAAGIGPGTEPRGVTRRRLLKGGVVSYNNRHSTIPCTVRDISDTGARLAVQGSVNAPDTFELFIELDGIRIGCRVVWRRASLVGVAFTTPVERVAPARKQVVQGISAAAKPSLRAAHR